MSTALILALALSGSADLALQVGQDAPPFSMRDMERKMFSLAHHVGADPKVPRNAVVMAFFATWCKPCIAELPILKKLHQRWRNQGVEFIHVGLSQTSGELGPFIEKHEVSWRVLPDPYGLLARRYGASELPHLLVIDAEGKVAFQHRGISPDLQNLLEGHLAAALGIDLPKGIADAKEVVRQRFSRTLTLGRVPSADAAVNHWAPLAGYLSETLAANVTLGTEASYEAFEAALRAGKYDIVNAGPLLCSAVSEFYDPLVQIERQDTPTYLGVVFTRQDSGIESIEGLSGKTLALVSERSTSGGLYPQKLLVDRGLKPALDVQIMWLGSHTKVAQAVRLGRAHAGACFEDCRDLVWTNADDKLKETRLLGYTDEIPAEMVVVRKGLDASTKDTLRKAFLAINDQHGVLKQMSQGELEITGFYTVSAGHLTRVADAIAAVAKAKERPPLSD